MGTVRKEGQVFANSSKYTHTHTHTAGCVHLHEGLGFINKSEVEGKHEEQHQIDDRHVN